MQKYNLEAIPVVDKMHRLVGRITIDDIVDVIKEEAEHDYQMAAGITEDVEADDTIWKLTRARLPWLLIGMAGGIGGTNVFPYSFALYPSDTIHGRECRGTIFRYRSTRLGQ